MAYITAKYGYLLCEYCGKHGYFEDANSDNPLAVWGHHIDWNRDNTDLSNCMIAHNQCNTHIHDNNLKDVYQECFKGELSEG